MQLPVVNTEIGIKKFESKWVKKKSAERILLHDKLAQPLINNFFQLGI